jgi:hypothetical protein
MKKQHILVVAIREKSVDVVSTHGCLAASTDPIQLMVEVERDFCLQQDSDPGITYVEELVAVPATILERCADSCEHYRRPATRSSAKPDRARSEDGIAGWRGVKPPWRKKMKTDGDTPPPQSAVGRPPPAAAR